MLFVNNGKVAVHGTGLEILAELALLIHDLEDENGAGLSRDLIDQAIVYGRLSDEDLDKEAEKQEAEAKEAKEALTELEAILRMLGGDK